MQHFSSNMASVLRTFVCRTFTVSTQSTRLLTAKTASPFLIRSFRHSPLSTSSAKGIPKPESVTVNFIDRDGDKLSVKAKVGDSLLDVAKDHDVDLEGACEGTLSCSTCHLIFNQDEMDKLNLDEPTDEELDMLDLAYGLTDTSRLGCQITVTKDFEGITLTIPKAHRDVRDA